MTSSELFNKIEEIDLCDLGDFILHIGHDAMLNNKDNELFLLIDKNSGDIYKEIINYYDTDLDLMCTKIVNKVNENKNNIYPQDGEHIEQIKDKLLFNTKHILGLNLTLCGQF